MTEGLGLAFLILKMWARETGNCPISTEVCENVEISYLKQYL